MASGRIVHLDDPHPTEIHWPDVVEHLARIPRFNGAAGKYSVAQHSVLVMEQFEEGSILRPFALLHDAHEAMIGDIIRPLQMALPRQWSQQLKYVKRKLDEAIFIAAGLDPLAGWSQQFVLAHADEVVLAMEKRDLLAECDAWQARVPPAETRIERVWGYREAVDNLERAMIECGVIR
jgi:hypothetical protein